MPYAIIMAITSLVPELDSMYQTIVGDEHSDPELMAKLEADSKGQVFDASRMKICKSHYRTCLSPRQVLDRLEIEGYTVVGVQTMNGRVNADGVVDAVSQWTLHKPNRPYRPRSISDSYCEPK